MSESNACAAVEQQVNKAMQIVDELLEDINKEVFISAAVADITRTLHPNLHVILPSAAVSYTTQPLVQNPFWPCARDLSVIKFAVC